MISKKSLLEMRHQVAENRDRLLSVEASPLANTFEGAIEKMLANQLAAIDLALDVLPFPEAAPTLDR
jgi:hypothetical protein